VEYAYLPQAHTDGDLYVFFPRENVLVAGGVVTGGSYPLPDYCTGGWLGGLIDGLKVILAKTDAQTRIVSEAGALRTRADVQAQLDMCTAVLGRIGTSYFKGETWQQLTMPSRPASSTRNGATRSRSCRWPMTAPGITSMKSVATRADHATS
jgi:glyoxylase-like metal-dependent hydrolase (beta-lactamase superfamily II)